ncbi:Orf9 [Lactococcus garvieae DCC43]|uniref:Orf9 n=1 Tax=Lactococcus garvieae DCC43 TaxID=1231377 RepID=K2PLN0_9LACT|nr:Orf9 [Lactococcus garvieae DCC43]
MTGTEQRLEALEKQKAVRKTLASNLEQVKALPWEQFDNVDSAEIPKALDLVQVLHNDVYEYPFIQIAGAEKNV